MRVVSLLLATLSLTLNRVLIEAAFSYDGLVLTSIDVKKEPIKGRPNRVEFYGGMNDGSRDDKTAVFLTNVKRARTEGFFRRRLILEADEVNANDVEKSGLKPLLCIHGFNVSPKKHLEECAKASELSKKFNLIPVIWPAKGNFGLLNYRDKQEEEAEGAGKAFKTLNKYVGMFPSKSLHAHSMGNRVLRYAADAGFTFDNIFMVAADTDARIFNKDYVEKNDEGLKIGQMIKNPKGKIHVLYNPSDLPLLASRILNGGARRLGRPGAKEGEDNIHPDLLGKVSSYNYREKHLERGSGEHNYHFDPPAMDYFNNNY